MKRTSPLAGRIGILTLYSVTQADFTMCGLAFPEPNSPRLTSERSGFLRRHKDYTSTPSRIIMVSRLSHSLPTAAGLSNTAQVGEIGDL